MSKINEHPSTCTTCGRTQYLQDVCYCCGGGMVERSANQENLRKRMKDFVDRMSLEELEVMSESWSVGIR